MTIEVILDTCALLDLIRAPVRPEFHPNYATGAVQLLAAIQNPNPPARILWTDITLAEFQNNLDEVAEDTRKSFRQLRDRYQKAHDVMGGFTAEEIKKAVDDAWIDSAVQQARDLAVTYAGLAAIEVATQDDLNKATGRVFKAVAPSRKGKDSLADCVITEVALRQAATAESRGVTKTVFFSSNTHEYCEGRQLKATLQTEFDACGLLYVRNWGEIHHVVFGDGGGGGGA